jgi:hypothetical protein
VELRVGIPGRGACCCCTCPGAGRVCCCCRRATISGRGGTTGRAAGCPARFGRGCGRKGVPGVGLANGADDSAGGGAVRATGCAGKVTDAGGIGVDGVGGGKGCRGPDKIWPGRGVGTGRAGTGPVRMGGCSGAAPLADNGGLKGAGLLRSGSSTVLTGASCAGVVAGACTSRTGGVATCA